MRRCPCSAGWLPRTGSGGRRAAGSTTTRSRPRRSPARRAAPLLVALLFRFEDPAIDEASGLAASARHPGIVYVHNDSGDDPRLFAVDEAGETVATVQVSGAEARDWEDIARGPLGLYVGDIGDNREARESVQLYVVPEPDTLASPRRVRAERYELVYPDGSHDAEALLVHPVTGEVGIVTKDQSGSAGLYVASELEPRTELRRVADVPLGSVTAGDVSPDADRVALRSYADVYEWELDGPTLASAFDEPPREVEAPLLLQAEALAYDEGGTRLLTTSEGVGAAVYAVPLEEGLGEQVEEPVPDPPPADPPARPGQPPLVALGALAAVAVAATLIALRARR